MMIRSPNTAHGRGKNIPLPYALPSAGQSIAVSANLPSNDRPAAFTASQWNYTMFDSFGGGALVPDYSVYGAYVIACSGGHGHPGYLGAAVFDFATALWTHLPCANDVWEKGPGAYTSAETSGEYSFEVALDSSLAAADTGVPAPPHPYKQLCYMPAGTKGSVIYVSRGAVTTAARPASNAHRFDLATRIWTRVAPEGTVAHGGSEASAVWDEARNRWWLSPTAVHSLGVLPYLDADTMAWGTVTGVAGNSAQAVYSSLMLHDGYLLRSSGPVGGLWITNPSSPGPWTLCTVSGDALPGYASPSIYGNQSAWAHHSDGCYYAFDGDSASYVVKRITPPADPVSGTWVVDSITLTGDQLPARTGSTAHYRRLVYVPALDCLAWLPGDAAVTIFKPPAV